MYNNYFSKEIQKDLRIIGWQQVIGGTAGIYILAKGVANDIYYSNAGIILYILAFIAFIFSSFCGCLCLLSNKKAILFSFINQAIQMIVFSFGGLTYCYLAGAFFVIGTGLGSAFKIHLDWGLAKFQFFIGSEQDASYFSLNISALLFLYWLYHLKKQAALEKSITEADSIGE